MRGSHQLVIAGGTPGARKEELQALAKSSGIGGRVVFPGFVTDEALRDLFQACELSVFPSFYEGFGLPVLEAMACGAPVAVSDRSSLSEIVEMAEARFDPDKAEEIAARMNDALSEPGFARELREYSLRRAGDFSWSRTARATVDAYEWLASQERARPRERSRAPSIAVCGPVGVPGSPFVTRIAERLAGRFGAIVDVVVESTQGTTDSDRVRYVNPVQFRSLVKLSGYDAVLYVLGGEVCAYLLEPVRIQRGLVWLRDIRLLPMYRGYYGDKAETPEELLHWARRYPSPESGLLLRDAETQRREAIFMLGEVASRATGLIVGSEAEREIAQMEGGGVPVTLLPRETWDEDAAIDAVAALLGVTEAAAVAAS